MKNGQKSSLYGETSLYSEEIPYSELFSKIHYIEYPLYFNPSMPKKVLAGERERSRQPQLT